MSHAEIITAAVIINTFLAFAGGFIIGWGFGYKRGSKT